MRLFKTQVLLERGEYDRLLQRLSALITIERDRARARDDVSSQTRLLMKALHQLAVASGSKDPSHFIRRWLNAERVARDGGVPIQRIGRPPKGS